MSNWPKSWLTASPGRACSSCGAKAGRPILRGLPTPEVFEALDKGVIDVALSGCCISDGDATYSCSACGSQFGATRREDGFARREIDSPST